MDSSKSLVKSFTEAFSTASYSIKTDLSDFKGSGVYIDLARSVEELPLLRDVGHASTRSTTINIAFVMIGAGVLGFPKLFARVGIPVGTALLTLCCATSIVMCTILGNSIEAMDRKLKKLDPTRQRITKMDDLGRACFGKPGELVAFMMVNASFVGKLGCFSVLIGQGLNLLMPFFAYRAWILVITGLMLPVAFLRDVSLVQRLAVIGVMASMIYISTIIGGSIKASSTRAEVFDPSPQTTVATCFSVFATMMFGFGPTDVLATIRRDMVAPEELPRALLTSHVVIGIVYLVAGVFGYWGFGKDVEGNISRSMCDSPGCPGTASAEGMKAGSPWMLGYVLSGAIVINLLMTMPIVQYCFFTGIESRYPSEQPMGSVPSAIMRFSLVLFAGAIGVFVPFFLEVVGILSACLLVPLVFVLPIGFSWKVARDCGEPHSGVRLVLDVLGLCLAAALCVIGLTEAIRGLQQQVAKNPAAANPFANFFD